MTILLIALAALLAVALWVHYLFEGERLLIDIWREWRLSRTGLDELDARWQKAPKSDVCISLTTIPSRIDFIEETLKGLLDQTVAPSVIYLNLPEYSDREQRPYVVPVFLKGLASVTVRRCKDWGPATKLIPTVLAVEANTPILVVDDDRIYPRDMVQTATKQAHDLPDVAFTFAGWDVPDDLIDRPTTIWSNLYMQAPAPIRAHRMRRPRKIDIVQGVMGYVMRPRFFDIAQLTDFSDTPRAGFLADDVRTSALCRVPKMVVPARGLSCLPKRRYKEFKRTALANLNRGDGSLEARNNTIAIRHYAKHWSTRSSLADTLSMN